MPMLNVTALRGRQKVFFEGSFETEELARLQLTEEHRFTLSRAERKGAPAHEVLRALELVFELIEIDRNRKNLDSKGG